MDSLSKKIKSRVYRKGRGWVFTPKDFLDLGSRAAVDQTLSRLQKDDVIRRLDRGVYDFPKQHPKIGILLPDSDAIADALARQTGDSIQVSGARAANLLGLSTQVPAKLVYFTTGPAKTRKIGPQTIRLKRLPSKAARDCSHGATLAVNAMLHLGKDNINDSVVQRLRQTLPATDKKQLMNTIGIVPDWLTPTIKDIAA